MRTRSILHISLLCAALIACSFAFTNPAAASLTPTNLKVEYRTNPVGIDVAQPRLSWILTSSDPAARGQMQTAYQIVVATSPALLKADKGDLWDTGRVASDQSIQMVYAGRPLISRQQVWWKVRVWDNSGNVSPWSEPARWSMGLLSPDDWGAKWIGLESGAAKPELHNSKWIVPDGNGTTAFFRREVAFKDKPIAALGMFASSGDMEIFINGRKADTPKRPDGTVAGDMAWFFRPGLNVIEISVKSASPQVPAVIAALDCDTTDGQQVEIHTDETWSAATEQPATWHDMKAASGAAAKIFGPYGMKPWGEIGVADRPALRARMLRKEFKAGPAVKRATVYVTGLGWFELYLNGKKVSNDVLVPALSDYDKHVYYLTYDVTKNLKAGANAVGVILGNGRFFSPRASFNIFESRTFSYPRMLMQLEIEYANGKRETIVSDGSWKLTDNGPVGYNNEYDGEDYDARKEMPGWDIPGFNDSSWQSASIVEAPGGKLTAQPIEPIRVRETLKPVKMTQVGPNRYIFDIGQNMVGWVRVTATGPAGAQLKMRHAETLRPDGSLYTDNLRTARATDVYTMKGGGAAETYEPRFVYHGFRYVEVTTSPGVSKPVIEGRVVYDDMRQIADFETSNPLLNQIHKNIVWGAKGNYHSLPTDCPQRDERMGWLGDRAASSRGEMFLFDNAALYDKWMTDVQDTQRPDGSLSDTAPAYWQTYTENVTWPASFIVIPRHLYELQGDKRVIELHYAAMKKWMEHMGTYIQSDLIAKDTYGDWCVPPEKPGMIHSQDPGRRTDGEVLATAYYYELLRIMADNARLLNKTQDAAEFDELAARMKLAFNKKYFHPETNTYANGTQTSSILPLAWGLVPDEHREQVFQSLVSKIEQQNKGHVGTGLIGIQWLMRTLTDNGRPDLAYEIASQTTYPSWGYMVSKGATTVWELWNGDTGDPAMNSGNHLMLVGDLNIWFYERLAGIRPDPAKPGFKHIILEPTPVAGLSWVKATHQSPYGKIASDWQKQGTHLRWDITVPPNTTATVYVPARSAESVTESGHAASSVKALKFLRMENGTAVYEAGSGTYSFTSEMRAE
jgi:alpha-L-rhamnosidase